jgi:hypothetical protein
MDDDGERPLGKLLVPVFLEMLNEPARERRLGMSSADCQRSGFDAHRAVSEDAEWRGSLRHDFLAGGSSSR